VDECKPLPDADVNCPRKVPAAAAAPQPRRRDVSVSQPRADTIDATHARDVRRPRRASANNIDVPQARSGDVHVHVHFHRPSTNTIEVPQAFRNGEVCQPRRRRDADATATATARRGRVCNSRGRRWLQQSPGMRRDRGDGGSAAQRGRRAPRGGERQGEMDGARE
jgi:hypothetical protein